LPFQVQITYTALSGMKCTRVITKTKEVTDNRTEAEQEIDVTVMGMHANWMAAKFVQKGDLEGAVNNNKTYRTIIKDNISDDIDEAGMAVWESDTSAYNDQIQRSQQQPQQPQQPQPQTDFLGTVSNFASNLVSTFSGARENSSPAPSPSANDDDMQNMVYARRNAHKNKSQWSARRKY